MKETRRNKAAWMFAKIDEWNESGMTKREFCSTNGIGKSTMDYWIQKKSKSNQKAPRFMELFTEPLSKVEDSVQVVNPRQSGRKRVELTFPDGLCIKVFL